MNLFKVILLITALIISTVIAQEEDLSPKDELSEGELDLEVSDSSTNVKRYIANNYNQKNNNGSHNKYNRPESKSRKFRSRNRKSRQKKGRSVKKINAQNSTYNVFEMDATTIPPKIEENPKLSVKETYQSNTQIKAHNLKDTNSEESIGKQDVLKHNKTEETYNRSDSNSTKSISNSLSDIIPNQDVSISLSNPETINLGKNATEYNNKEKVKTAQKKNRLDNPTIELTTSRVDVNTSIRMNIESENNNAFDQTKHDFHVNQVNPNNKLSTNAYEPKEVKIDLGRRTQNKLESSGSDERRDYNSRFNSIQERSLGSKNPRNTKNDLEDIDHKIAKIGRNEFQSNNHAYSLNISKPKEEDGIEYPLSKSSNASVEKLQSKHDEVKISQAEFESKATSEPQQTKEDLEKRVTQNEFQAPGSVKSKDYGIESNHSVSRSIISRSPKEKHNSDEKHMISKAKDETVRTHVEPENDRFIENRVKPENTKTVSEPEKFETHLSESDLEFIISELINTNHENREHIPESKAEPEVKRQTFDNNISKTSFENNAQDLKTTQDELAASQLKSRVSISKSRRKIPKHASENYFKESSKAETESPVFHTLKPVNVEIQYEEPLPNDNKIETKPREPNQVNRHDLNREELDSLNNLLHRKNYGTKPKIPTVNPEPESIQRELVSINRGHNYNKHRIEGNRRSIGTEKNRHNIRIVHEDDEKNASPSKTSFVPKNEISVPIYHEVVLELESPTSDSRERTESKITHLEDTNIRPINGKKEISEKTNHKVVRYAPPRRTTNDDKKVGEHVYRSYQSKHQEPDPKSHQVLLVKDKPDQEKKHFISRYSPEYKPISSTETSYKKNVQNKYLKSKSQRIEPNYHTRTEHTHSISKPKENKPVYPQANSESEQPKPHQRDYKIKYKETVAIHRTATSNPNTYERRFRRLEPKKIEAVPEYSTESEPTQRKYKRPIPESKRELTQKEHVEERYIPNEPKNNNVLRHDSFKRTKPNREKFVPKYDDSELVSKAESIDTTMMPETTTSSRNFLLKAFKDWW